jgi:hypothetical protein
MSSTIATITTSADFPYGAFDSHSMTGSTDGYPPLMNPAAGEIIMPVTTAEIVDYPVLARKLADAMFAATPSEVSARVSISLRTDAHDGMNAAYSLSLCAFMLAESDLEHPLIKIATLTDFAAFKAAVRGL